jgi:hypothetical protein
MQKIRKFQYACGIIERTLRDKTIKDTMLKFFKVLRMLVYGSEFWTMNEADKRAVEAPEMKFLRYVAGCTHKDQVRHDNIRQRLNIFNLNDRIHQNKINGTNIF